MTKPITPIIAMPIAVTLEKLKYSSRSGFLATFNTLLLCFIKSLVVSLIFIENPYIKVKLIEILIKTNLTLI